MVHGPYKGKNCPILTKAHVNRIAPNQTRAIHKNLCRIVWSFTIGAQQSSVSVVELERDTIDIFNFKRCYARHKNTLAAKKEKSLILFQRFNAKRVRGAFNHKRGPCLGNTRY